MKSLIIGGSSRYTLTLSGSFYPNDSMGVEICNFGGERLGTTADKADRLRIIQHLIAVDGYKAGDIFPGELVVEKLTHEVNQRLLGQLFAQDPVEQLDKVHPELKVGHESPCHPGFVCVYDGYDELMCSFCKKPVNTQEGTNEN